MKLISNRIALPFSPKRAVHRNIIKSSLISVADGQKWYQFDADKAFW